MSKIQKQQLKFIPQSEWDDLFWTKETYQRHELDFQKILKEYRELVLKYNDVRLARWKWIELKGGLTVHKNGSGIYEPQIIENKYKTISNMFGKFNDWLSFKEKIEMTSTQRAEKISEIKKGLGKIDFSIPQSVMSGAERDVSYEEEKQDDIVQSALDNF